MAVLISVTACAARTALILFCMLLFWLTTPSQRSPGVSYRIPESQVSGGMTRLNAQSRGLSSIRLGAKKARRNSPRFENLLFKISGLLQLFDFSNERFGTIFVAELPELFT